MKVKFTQKDTALEENLIENEEAVEEGTQVSDIEKVEEYPTFKRKKNIDIYKEV